ncbi:hypothetical protein KR074_009730 [Drosophila pseudoananassae]|nr:hypothetical protein KR074_009730 [Drosophila pseudoananassae]
MSQGKVMAMRKGSTGDLPRKPNGVVVNLPPVVKKSSKSRSFHFRYMELCRAKNLTPVPEIRNKSNTTTFLELCGDKLAVSDWLLLTEALHYDLVLQQLTVRLRRTYPQTNIDSIDTEKRARLFRQRPVIYTRFIFHSLVQAIANCVASNKNLSVLKLEGLPLQDGYIDTIAKSLADNECLETVSFRKSNLGDRGCEAVCNTAKYLNRIETFDLSECGLTSKGAEHVAEMIKMQKITRYSEGWEKSLRYRSVDVNTISGLRVILLANNPEMGDDGVRLIAEVLKEDAWIKTVDMENCGLTDIGANVILDCLELNTAITEFNIRNNDGISKFLQRSIRDHFGEPAEEKQEPEFDLSFANGLQSLPKNKKVTLSQLLSHAKALEEQLSFERTLRKKAEKLNEKLLHSLMSSSDAGNMSQEKNSDSGSLQQQSNYGARNEEVAKNSQSYRQTHFNRLVNSTVTSPENSPRSDIATLRKEQQLQQMQQQQLQLQLQQQQQMQLNQLQMQQQQSPHLQMQHSPPEPQTLRTLREEPVEEEEIEHLEDSQSELDQLPEMQQQRKPLKVRKVRSEIKYVEANLKDQSKNRESKSDHEFANERDFKLNPALKFETDIGDSVKVNSGKPHDGEGNPDYPGYNFEQEHQPMKRDRGHENGYVGDGCRKPMSLGEALKRYGAGGGSGDGHVAQYVSNLERKTSNSGNKSGRQRYKAKQEELRMESYMSSYEEFSSTDETTVDNSESEAENTESTLRGSGSSRSSKYSSMQVFMRRKHSQALSTEEDCAEDDDEATAGQGDAGDGDGGGGGDTGGEKLPSPREVYLALQRKKREQNS